MERLTKEERLTIKLALEERYARLSQTLSTLTDKDDMHRVYVDGLVAINNTLDKLFPVVID